ncbi:acetyltransferase (GNAT) family protein [Lentzea atacamensis]|uniref:Acetyltransferase (GNAT) family protein n=1 Tax=Lentzea atacamensis TaxID=531938 RepID=A0ABX9DWG0_9PSEU|nr:GNAT family N-acetyltransferase [Lentzea atacamensis]RAS59437.1 acetyltransferase (GNAT) family protein [Lentzea atacamensis]
MTSMLASLTVHNGSEVSAEDLRAMLARCSPCSLRARFLGSGVALEQLAAALTGAASSRTLVARVGTTVVGIGSVDGPAPYELAVLVEDRWQRRGVGRRLVTTLVSTAAAHGVDELTVAMAVGNVAAQRLVRALWPCARFTAPEAGMVEGLLSLRDTEFLQHSPLRVGTPGLAETKAGSR